MIETLDFLDIRVIMRTKNSIIEKVGTTMARQRFKTLTEQMFYVLLSLHEECRGMDILEKVNQITNGRVNVGSGTLYDLLELFVKEGMIRETKVEGRRRSYCITEKGLEMLKTENKRLLAQSTDYARVIKRRET